jgi:hypothetical protein
MNPVIRYGVVHSVLLTNQSTDTDVPLSLADLPQEWGRWENISPACQVCTYIHILLGFNPE